MKKHNTLKVVLITILVLLLLTWILPAAYYSSGYVDQGRIQMGLFDLFNYPLTALSYFGYIAAYVLVIGAFYGVLNKIGAYRSLLDKMVKCFKGKEKIVLSVIMIAFALITSICSLQIGLFVLFPMVISLILLMGYDKITAALVVVGSTMVGVMGSTYGYTNTNLIISTLSLKIDSELLSKIIILIVGLILLIFNTMLYIKKIESNNKKTKKHEKVVDDKKSKTSKVSKTSSKTKTTKSSVKSAAKSDDKVVVENDSIGYEFVPCSVKSKKYSLMPLIITFVMIFIVLILAFVSWSGAFNNTAFTDATSAVTGFKLFGFELFAKILGSVKEFGSWTFADMSVVLILAMALLSLIYKLSFDDMIDSIRDGAKKAIKPAIIVILLYTCLVIVTYHPFQLVIYKFLLGLTKGFNVLTTSLVAILSSLFNVDPSYAYNSALPYLISVVTDTKVYPIIGVIFQSLYGATMLVAPTSVVLMTVLSYLDIPYKTWFKNIWKLLLELVVVLAIIFVILVLV